MPDDWSVAKRMATIRDIFGCRMPDSMPQWRLQMSTLPQLSAQQKDVLKSKKYTKTIVETAWCEHSGEHDDKIILLFNQCFEGVHEGRVLFKQEPHLRILSFFEEELIGHLGLDFRAIRVGDAVILISGVIDLCVCPRFRNIGLAGELLCMAQKLSKKRDYLVLMADDCRLYKRNGYQALVDCDVTWLAIEDLHSHSLVRRDLSDIFMFKSIREQAWPVGV